MMNEKVQNAMNEQVKHELESAYLYLSMAAYFHFKGLDGMAKWMRVQCQEEMVHARKFFDHIRDREGRVVLQSLSQPKSEWASPLDAFKESYKHEQFITGKINAIVKLAAEQADYASTPILNWFVDEQIEEETQVSKIAQMLERVGTSGAGLLMLDKELGKREFKE